MSGVSQGGFPVPCKIRNGLSRCDGSYTAVDPVDACTLRQTGGSVGGWNAVMVRFGPVDIRAAKPGETEQRVQELTARFKALNDHVDQRLDERDAKLTTGFANVQGAPRAPLVHLTVAKTEITLMGVRREAVLPGAEQEVATCVEWCLTACDSKEKIRVEICVRMRPISRALTASWIRGPEYLHGDRLGTRLTRGWGRHGRCLFTFLIHTQAETHFDTTAWCISALICSGNRQGFLHFLTHFTCLLPLRTLFLTHAASVINVWCLLIQIKVIAKVPMVSPLILGMYNMAMEGADQGAEQHFFFLSMRAKVILDTLMSNLILPNLNMVERRITLRIQLRQYNREVVQKPHGPHAAFVHCAKPHDEPRVL
ncbi:hypothetical protein K438DRAFT_1776932 [Mycena galopus ATCC 62051]|nr:hypothetical protein K438DRAFT_1776932 [Mycena galopus ATCC 62051]